MPRPQNHLLEVEATFINIRADENVLDVRLPVWRPGRYLILDLANGVQDFSASATGGAGLQWQKIDKSTWRVQTKGARSLTVRYRIYANEFDKKTRGLDMDHAFVSGESVFMYTDRHRPLPVELTVVPYATWHVTTGLDDVPGRPNTFAAPSYDHLIDCPLEIGTQQDVEFTAEGVRHVISLSGQGNWNADTLIRDISKIIAANKKFWGRLPYHKYVFLFHCLPYNGGGVEHVNSTILGVRGYGFQNPSSYAQILGLISHEFFHTWNVKQLRPRSLQPYDLQRENYSNELWIAEGTTSYYGGMMLIQAGLRTGPGYFLEYLPGAITDERSRPGNTEMSLTESSFDAWIKYWRGNENSFNAETDFYNKGSLVSLLLDLEIRHRSNNQRNLGTMLRLMFERFPLSGPGYTVDDFQHTAEECAGGSLSDFFERYVHGKSPLPWEGSLLYAGLELTPKDTSVKISLGMTMQQGSDEKVKIMRVVTDSPAEDAGLEVGDEIIAFNGVRVTLASMNERIGEMREGTQGRVTFFRDDVLKETTVTARRFGAPQYTIRKISQPSELQKSIYESWLYAPWNAPGAGTGQK
ncbi:MAG TPA: PDZ domain-containing protein [Bacteroidota bacterium]|nr:PDZ domain-containing protein [Bacteroidota bacterium]